jgi:large subunit ribosomal protein L10
MTKEEKNKVIEELAVRFSAASTFYISDIAGMTVQKTSQLRRQCFNSGIQLKVAKNTLIRKALEKSGKECSEMFPQLTGSSSIMFSETGNGPAKVIKEFRKSHEKPVLKAAFVESTVYIGDNELNTLASLKSKKELIADVVALLQSPAKNVISGLLTGKDKLGGIVKTLSERPEKT